MKITIIDQEANTVHELAAAAENPTNTSSFIWFDPSEIPSANEPFLFTEDDDSMTSSRVRFKDGREIEVDCKTGDLVGV